MTPILDRIHANGGNASISGWHLRIRRGRLSDKALDWVKENRNALINEVWPQHDEWQERAAIREYDGGQNRADAEREAYIEIMEARYA